MKSPFIQKDSRVRTLLRRLVLTFLTLIALVTIGAGAVYWYHHPPLARQEKIVYGNRDGTDLTFFLIQPEKSNGKAVLVMNSGSWKSNDKEFRTWAAAPLLRAGYTIFGISHISQPKVTIMEIVDDIERGIRFIRHHADDYGVDPDSFGITGGSSGGHLSLCMATLGGPGAPEASDPIERESSEVQAVAVFFPVTDLINLGDSTENLHDGGPPKSYVKGFGPEARDLKKWQEIGRSISPIFHVTRELPPTLIYHGDADTLVPIDQSTRFKEAADRAGAEPVEIVVRPGKGHGWLRMVLDIHHFASWFDEHL